MKSLVLTINVFRDLLTLLLPDRSSAKDYKFAFIVHPRSYRDIERKFPFFRYVPEVFIDIVTKYLWPVTVSKISGLKSLRDGREIEGYVISILPTAHQMVENRNLALKRITQACILARKMGVKIVGLGGLTSSLSKGGLDLINVVGVNITTGHAYTSYNVTQNIFALVHYMNFDKKKICIGIVGAAGSIGSTCAKLLARDGFEDFLLVDLERKKSFFSQLTEEINTLNPRAKVDISHQIKDIKKCDIVIAATNAPEALIRSEDLKWGAIVVDDAQPSDVHPNVYERQDVLVIEAGVTSTPQIENNFNFGLKNRDDNFCCLAEVFILAANEWRDHYVINRASLSHVDQVSRLGERLNFRIGQFQNLKELVSNKKLLFVKKCINENGLST